MLKAIAAVKERELQEVTKTKRETVEKSDILNLYPSYRSANQRAQEWLLRVSVLAELPSRRVIQQEGQPCNQFYWLGEGSVRVYKSDRQGKEITLYHVSRGENCALSASAIFTGCPYPATAVVEEKGWAVLITASNFNKLLGDTSQFRSFVCKLIGSGIGHLMHLVHELAFDNMESRVAYFLYKRFENDGHPHSMINETHARIGAELGYGREVISRTLENFEKNEIIKLDRARITLLNAEALSKEAMDSKKNHLCNICYRHTLKGKCIFEMA